MPSFKYDIEDNASVIEKIINAFGMMQDPDYQEVKRLLSEDKLSVIAETSKEKRTLTLEFIDSIETRNLLEFLGDFNSSMLKDNFTGSRLTFEVEEKITGNKKIAVVEEKCSKEITINQKGTHEVEAVGDEFKVRDIADQIRHILRTEWVFEPPRPTTYPDWPLDPESAPKAPWNSHFTI